MLYPHAYPNQCEISTHEFASPKITTDIQRAQIARPVPWASSDCQKKHVKKINIGEEYGYKSLTVHEANNSFA